MNPTDPPAMPPLQTDSTQPSPDAYETAGPSIRRSPALKLGGALGVAACALDAAIFVASCAGFGAAMKGFPIVPLLLGAGGMVMTIVGLNGRNDPPLEGPDVLGPLFINALGLLGALVEMALWLSWTTFPRA
jgi:hypothetical protein